MSHFDIDKYAELNSPMHRFDPRAKITCILILIFSIVLLEDIKILLIGFLIVLILVYLSKIPLLFILKRLKWVALFMIAILIILPLTIDGKEIFNFYFLTVSEEGIKKACMISLKAFSVILLIFPMLATMKFFTFIKALEKLKVPNKLIQIIALTYRYIFVLLNEIQKTTRALESRGFKKKTNLFHLRIVGNIIGMLLVRSYERSEKVYNAMVARGYDGTICTLKKFKMTAIDWAKVFSIIAITVFLHLINFINNFEVI